MDRLKETIRIIDLKNSEDPNKTNVEGKAISNEILYAQRMTDWLFKLNPNPSEFLQIAVRANHIKRWEIARNTYPMTRQGYLQWREELIVFHIHETIQILKKLGYSDAEQGQVEKIMSKNHIKGDADCQLYEDVICLTFLEHYFAGFYDQKKPEEKKVHTIVKKTWFKMSEKARNQALTLDMPKHAQQLIKSALGV